MALGSLARSSARHPRIVIAVWAFVFVISIGLAGGFWGKGLTAERVVLIDTESNTADKLLEERFRGPRPITEIILVRSDTYSIVDPQFEATVQNIFFDIAALGPDVVAGVSQYYHSGTDSQVSEDGQATIMSVAMVGTLDEARANAVSVRYPLDNYSGQDEFDVAIVGEASIADRVADLGFLLFQWPLMYLLFIPAVMLPSVPSSRLPFIVGLVSVVVPVGASALIGQAFPVSVVNNSAILVTGLAVGMGCSHFIASRYREERSGGAERLNAIAITYATTGRPVLSGSLASVILLACIAIVPVNFFMSVGFGAVLAASVALLASVTLAPALLALTSEWASGFRVSKSDDSEEATTPPKRRIDFRRLSQRVVDKALARPLPSVSIATAVLLVLAALSPQLNLGLTGVESLPEPREPSRFGPQVKYAYSLLTEDFPAGVLSPVEIVIDAPFKDPDIEPRVAQLQAAVASDPDFAGESRIQNNQDYDMVLITVPTRDLPESETARDAVWHLRNVYVPEVFADTGVDVLVTGGPALAADYMAVVERYAPFVAIVVLVLSVLALLISTRSLAVPLLATIAHLLSFAAAYGVVVLTLQQGIGAGLGLLRYHHTPTIEISGLLLSFTLFFGIYAVHDLYLMARVRERYAQTGGDIDDALTHGLRSFIWVSTATSLLTAAMFFILALGDLPVFHQAGFALTVAVLIDAVIVRLVLLPASLKLLGAAAFYFPRTRRVRA